MPTPDGAGSRNRGNHNSAPAKKATKQKRPAPTPVERAANRRNAPLRKKTPAKKARDVRTKLSDHSTRGEAIDGLLDTVQAQAKNPPPEDDETESGDSLDDVDTNPEESDDETPGEPGQGNDDKEPLPDVVKRAGKSNRRYYDWDSIRELYVEGIEQNNGEVRFPELQELSNRLGVPYNRIKERCAAERWRDMRGVAQHRHGMELQRTRHRKAQQDLIKLDGTVLGGAQLGAQLVMGRLHEIGRQFTAQQARAAQVQQAIANGLPVTLEDLRSPVYYREMNELAMALGRFHEIGRAALGESVVGTVHVEHGGTVSVGGDAPARDAKAEMGRGDPQDLADVVGALAQAGVLADLGLDGSEEEFHDNDDVEDAEVVEDTDEPEDDDAYDYDGKQAG